MSWQWEVSGVNANSLLVYHFTERQNHTVRPNREMFKQRRYSLPKWPVDENECIFHIRIRNVVRSTLRREQQDPAFMLFDKTLVCRIKNPKKKNKAEEDSQSIADEKR